MFLSQFTLTFQETHNGMFNCIAYDYSCADWDGFRNHLSDASWEDAFELNASGAAGGFFDWVQVGIDVDIPHPKYQV